MNCPVCNETLLLNNRQGVEIDYCPKCRGIWLDRGEFDKIIERSNNIGYGESQSTTPHIINHHNDDHEHSKGPDYRSGHNGNYGYNKHANTTNRKKGFLGDLFDF